MDWKRMWESDLCFAKEGDAYFHQTHDGVWVSYKNSAKFVPMREWSEGRGREVAELLKAGFDI